MKAIVDVTTMPVGSGIMLAPCLAACEKIFAKAGLKTKPHINGNLVEGEWDAVFGAIKECHEAIHGMGILRISTVVEVDTVADPAHAKREKGSVDQRKLIRAGVHEAMTFRQRGLTPSRH